MSTGQSRWLSQTCQAKFWQTKPAEELYDLRADPDEVNNLADSKKHAEILQRLRKAQRDLAVKIRDVGFLPEGEIHSRSDQRAPYDMGHNDKLYPMERVLEAAEIASGKGTTGWKLSALLKDEDSAVRYWAAMAFVIRGEAAVNGTWGALLRETMSDKSPDVACTAAEAVGRFSKKPAEVNTAIDVLLKFADGSKQDHFTAMLALNALDALDGRARKHIATIRALPRQAWNTPAGGKSYIPNLLTKIIADLEE